MHLCGQTQQNSLVNSCIHYSLPTAMIQNTCTCTCDPHRPNHMMPDMPDWLNLFVGYYSWWRLKNWTTSMDSTCTHAQTISNICNACLKTAGSLSAQIFCNYMGHVRLLIWSLFSWSWDTTSQTGNDCSKHFQASCTCTVDADAASMLHSAKGDWSSEKTQTAEILLVSYTWSRTGIKPYFTSSPRARNPKIKFTTLLPNASNIIS